MRRTILRLAPEWDPQFTRATAFSLCAHLLAIAALVVVGIGRGGSTRPLPLTAYTVDLVDPAALGGRLPPGPLDKPLGPNLRTGGESARDAVTSGAPEASVGAPVVEALPATALPLPKPAHDKPQEALPPRQIESSAPAPNDDAPLRAPARPVTREPEPVKKAEPPKPEPVKRAEAPKPEPAKKAEPPKPEPVKRAEAPKPEPAKKAEPPKPEPVKRAEAPKSEPVKKAEAPKSEPAKKAEPPKPASGAAPPRSASTPSGAPPTGGRSGGPGGGGSGAEGGAGPGGQGPAKDAYALAMERRLRAGGGGGLGGSGAGAGPIGVGGEGPGGGGQVVGLEFLRYRQLVIDTVKANWANALRRSGLVAKVRFRIAADGTISDVRVAAGSGDPAYDLSAVRAVQRANPLPPPPVSYRNEFAEFLIEFHSQDQGGRGAG